MLFFGYLFAIAIVLPSSTYEGYPRSDLLIEPGELAKPEAMKQYVILDARDKQNYRAGHVPGAISSPATEWAKAFQNGRDPVGWAKRLSELGLTTETNIVIYDDASNKDAARVWWILKYWGVTEVKLLHGMWTGWKQANHPISTEEVNPERRNFVPAPQAERLATKKKVLESLQSKSSQIVDARTEAEHTGKNKLAQQGGCIPGATNLDWENLIDKKTQRFKSAEELKKMFEQQHIDLSKPLTAHCQSGGRSSVMSFALELMGAKSVQNYHASWAEWGNSSDTPVENRSSPEKK